MSAPLKLFEINSATYDVELEIAYATYENFTGKPVYDCPICLLHKEAKAAFEKAIKLAASLDLKIKIFDAFRPQEAQWKLWEFCPDSTFVADPLVGSNHSRGVAIDLTLVDAKTLKPLDMGTPFDDFTSQSFHGDRSISLEAQRNRLMLLGIMALSGWDFYDKEWWHYQLPSAQSYPLIKDGAEGPRLLKVA